MKCGRHDLRDQRQKHLQANESQHNAEADLEIMKFFDDAGEQEIKRAQAENCEDVGSVNDEAVGSDAKDCRNRINGENEIGNFDHDQHEQQQRSHALAVDDREELPSLVASNDRNVTCDKANNRVVFRVDFFLTPTQHLNAGVD